MTGKELKRRRKALGLTQAQIAPLLGATKRAVGSWETGARNIPASVPLLFEFRKALGGGVWKRHDVNPPAKGRLVEFILADEKGPRGWIDDADMDNQLFYWWRSVSVWPEQEAETADS